MYHVQCATYELSLYLQHFRIGTKVLLKKMKNSHRMGGKLDAKWDGPYTVEAKLSKGCYQLRSKNGIVLKKLYNCCLLKEYNL